MWEDLKKLKFAIFEFILTPFDTIVFPEFKGNVFRGSLGKTLRYLSCAFKDKNCMECLIRKKCIYSLIFESIHHRGESILQKVSTAPHPFIIYVPDKHHLEYPHNKKIRFYLTLVGEVIEYISYFVLAFEEMGYRGIGKNRVPFQIQEIRCNGKNIYHPDEKIIRKDFSTMKTSDFFSSDNNQLIFSYPKEQVKKNWEPEYKKSGENNQKTEKDCQEIQRIGIELITPMRLKFNRKIQKYLTFEMLVSNLLRRLYLLNALYCNGPDRVDFMTFKEKARQIKTTNAKIHWHSQTRYSFRQDKHLGMGGVCGDIEFRGDLGIFLPYLKLAEFLHIGKGTAFGLGKIKAQALPYDISENQQ